MQPLSDKKRKRLVARVKSQARRLDGIGHLGPEAVVAFVDGEMPAKAMHRVRVHLVNCAECLAEVHRQRLAASWVRSEDDTQGLRAPTDLLERLNGIAATKDPPVPPEPERHYASEQDLLDKIEMIGRALRRGHQS
ncbi:hypothetical protein CPHO_07815 [Corynebacterium phocae]|uniref:Putative zinc-finger domain-containing protein n=1 Tax=Corynebacterium phocae TaxID=161895 RepID=A0A1L7D3X5_9CORY|nr:hypothetical protein CPHO_07815 [Corynebacterium phocae]